jgi:hypothetical protein
VITVRKVLRKTNSMGKRQDNQFSSESLQRRLIADLPALERLVMTIHEFCGHTQLVGMPSPCKSCPKYGQCENPYERLKVYLDGPYVV